MRKRNIAIMFRLNRKEAEALAMKRSYYQALPLEMEQL